MMLGEGVVEDGGAGPGTAGETVARAQPLFVQGVEAVERGVQDAELVPPAVLHRVGRQASELRVGCGQQVAGAGADVLERFGGVGVALALAEPVGVVVVRPAVEVGVLVGVDVPGVEDRLAVADEAVDMLQEIAVKSQVAGTGGAHGTGQGEGADPRVGRERRRQAFRVGTVDCDHRLPEGGLPGEACVHGGQVVEAVLAQAGGDDDRDQGRGQGSLRGAWTGGVSSGRPCGTDPLRALSREWSGAGVRAGGRDDRCGGG
ncbi:hypothetical protein ACFWNG_18395 [Streptomyces sp. NPDC058391]|uniref:hypothetical protein n=1 Tax=Streptomyces sp. NPDC058391 TaxID=3346476 RepID=UPI00365AE4C1